MLPLHISRKEGISPKGLRIDPRDGILLLQGQSERAGSVNPGEEKALEKPDSSLLVSKGGL